MAVILHERRRLSEREAAAYLGPVTARTLQDWRTNGVGPAYSKLGRRVCYAIEDLDAFIAGGRVEPKSAASDGVGDEG
ncbi:helix-turn-helix domain-containing protein [Noviluteimonas gilva]|uniref:Helix-turn-helix domain-containing protein n=1 Tax=Noviluteimonas gilva TaxID=2682097 RepID=A0A7C9M524_9GAMM|nr:helix-turn-helix domain-containing protein [Lysobacter gilvus]MUV15426.1 helix-turn-helix domain-containing protein [Lysobacter gilvus]